MSLNRLFILETFEVPIGGQIEEQVKYAKEKGIEIHTRSVFLQGLFFLGMDKIDKDFQPAKDIIRKLCEISFEQEIPVCFLCLCFVLLNPLVDKVVIGVDSIDQLKQNMDSAKYMNKTKNVYGALKKLRMDDEKIIFPFNWI